MPKPTISLSDRYTVEDGTIYLSGLQALARLPLDLRRADTREGLRSAAMISGYEGSPLAGYDLELLRNKKLLEDNDIHLRQGVNEELAVNIVQGSQLAGRQSMPRHDGVIGIWYAKAPGLDRASDAMRHANLGGSDARGGALVLVGDDSMAKSSTVPSSSEIAMAELGLPVLSPSDPQDILDLGMHGVALSRFTGLWVGMKIATNVADGSSTTHVSPERFTPAIPSNKVGGVPFVHRVTSDFLQPTLSELEDSLFNKRLPLAARYASENGLNKVFGAPIGSPAAVGIVTAGATYLDVRQALASLGLNEAELERRGVRLLKLGMVSPLDRSEIKRFTTGLQEVIVVEEKRSFVEAAIKEILYGDPQAPAVSGKTTPEGTRLLRMNADLDSDLISDALRLRLPHHLELPEVATKKPTVARRRPRANLPLLPRTPFFCSGCPHNRSTRTPEGSLVGAGIGCSGMVALMPEERVGEVVGFTQMGGEGIPWIGMSPFLDKSHMLQNMGDGTYHHSGSLAIRASIAAGTSITYKILYNSAVAMTGGQAAIGGMSVEQIARDLLAEGVRRVVITTEDVKRYRKVKLPSGVEVRDRDRLIETQDELAAIEGVTILIHDQECATELRRKRKRKLVEAPTQRAFINQRVCEGCGDCGEKSNCMSVQPVATDYGRKTKIHQASCNLDFSCLDGDCPSFLSVTPATGGHTQNPRPTVADIDDALLPTPETVVRSHGFGLRITGIGGTGVVTVAQIISTAGSIAGHHVQALDQTGLAQKGGAVVSDVKFASGGSSAQSNKVARGEADLYIGCDVLVAASDKNLLVADPERTVAVVSTAEVPTGAMITDTSVAFPEADDTLGRIQPAVREDQSRFVDARQLTRDLFDDDQFANVFLVGVAFQLGALPLGADHLEQAITLNGVAVDRNIQAFRRGRQFIADKVALLEDVAALAVPISRRGPSKTEQAVAAIVKADAGSKLADLVQRRVTDLVAYQDRAYAERYARTVEQVRSAELASVGEDEVSLAVAQHLYKLMAYKDEYEVARLSIDPQLEADLLAEFGPGYRARYRLHPPVLRALGMKKKISLGPWFRPVFAALYSMRRLRGTFLDPFGFAKVRRIERRLIREYEGLVDEICGQLDKRSHPIAIELANMPDTIRGYEHVKERNVKIYDDRIDSLRAQLTRPESSTSVT